MSLLYTLIDQIMASRQTARPIVAVTLGTDDWCELRRDPNILSMLCYDGASRGEPMTIAGATLYVRREPRGTSVWTDREALFDLISSRQIDPAH